MATYSTQTSVEARISATRLTALTDFDGDTIADPATIAAGIAFAGGFIAGKLKQRYGQDTLDLWLLPDDVPPLIAWISDTLCIWDYNINKPGLFPDVESIFNSAHAMLIDLAEGTMDLDDVNIPTGTEFQTEAATSDFEAGACPQDASVKPTWILPDPREETWLI